MFLVNFLNGIGTYFWNQAFLRYMEMALHLFQDHKAILRGYSTDYQTVNHPNRYYRCKKENHFLFKQPGIFKSSEVTKNRKVAT